MANDRTLTRQPERSEMAPSTTTLLTAVFPADLQWRIAVPDRVIEIGRQSSSEGVPPLLHPTVSRAHLSLRPDPASGLHLARDLGSHNGSAHAGMPLSADDEVVIRDGSLLQIGDVLLVYEVDDLGDRMVAGALVDRGAIPGRSIEIARVRSHIARAASDPAPLLLVGETGTGKEWIAREAHRLSQRAGDFVAINCAALSSQLIESQLFGHVKGAFTGAATDQAGYFRAANGGTLLLDEIGEMPLELQPKLLRVLQEQAVQPVGGTSSIPIDVRVIAATNRDLAHMVETGSFRRDLYARLALWELELPPLRQRRVDILDWVERLHRGWHAQRGGGEDVEPIDLSADAASAIVMHTWPENLRGIERLVHAIAPIKGRVGHGDLPAWITDRPTVQTTALAPEPRPSRPAKKPIPGAEEFSAALEELRGNISAMAKRFGRDRRQIYRWIESYGLEKRRQELLDS